MRSPEMETTGAGDPISVSRQLLSSLSGSISTVQCFRGRWSAVESCLRRIDQSLSSLNPNPNPNRLLDELLLSLSQTLTLTLLLSRHSQSPTPPPAGKLRTQSDISAAASSLDRLAADLDLLVLEEEECPSSSSSPIKNLVSRLPIGSSASRQSALEALIPILKQDDKNVVVAAAHGAIPAIVRLLDSHETRVSATAAVARVSEVGSCRETLMAEGSALLNHLCRILESDSGYAKENACLALETLTVGRESAISISSRGGIPCLLEICRSGTPSAAASAAGVLRNLAEVGDLRLRFVEENAIPVLIRVFSSGTPSAMENSVRCLRNLLAPGEEVDASVIMLMLKEGILNSLVNYWDKGRDLEPAVGLLRYLALSKYGSHAVYSSELLPKVVSTTDSSSSATRAEAARAIGELSGKGVAEAVPKLVRMLEAKSLEEKVAAVKALASLVAVSSGNRRAFRKEDKGIVNVVLLLEPSMRSVDKRYPVAVLLSVSQSRKCRRQMAACGACGFLKRLVGVGVEVEGAKKLLDSLEKGKILGVFPRN